MNTQTLAQGQKVAGNTIIRLIVIAVVKALVGLLTGLPVLYADALSTFTRTLGIFASYMGLKLSRKAATTKFAYGYHKTETFAALLISIGIIYLGYIIAAQGFRQLFEPTPGHYRTVAIITSVASIYFAARLSRKLQHIAEKTNSLSLLTIAKDRKSDIFAGFGVLASIIANFYGVPYFEGIVTLILSVLILKDGIWGIKESLFYLLDYWNDPVLKSKIARIIRKEKAIIAKIKRIRMRRAGVFIFGEAFVEINPFIGIEDLREELDLVENKIKELNPHIKDFAIHSHVPKVNKFKVAVPIKNGRSLNAEVSFSMKQTQSYLFASIKGNRIVNHYIRKFPISQKNQAEITDFFTKEKTNVLIDCKIGSLLYFHLRRTHHILIYPNFSDTKTARKTLEVLLIDT